MVFALLPGMPNLLYLFCILAAQEETRSTEQLIDSVATSFADGGTDLGLVEEFINDYSPVIVESAINRKPDLIPKLFNGLSFAMTNAEPALLENLMKFHIDLARAGLRRAGSLESPPTGGQKAVLLSCLVWHPKRFVSEARFRKRITASLSHILKTEGTSTLKDWLMAELLRLPDFDYEDVEKLALDWGFLPRSSRERQLSYLSKKSLKFIEDDSPIAYSIFSLSSTLFTSDDALRFLQCVLEINLDREILVITDLPLTGRLGKFQSRVHLISPQGNAFSPWPRDPISFFQDDEGKFVVMNRADLQPKRESDFFMARALVSGLPEPVDLALGGVFWSQSQTSFHNGNILPTHGKIWITLHGLERNILKKMGLAKVPVESFVNLEGIERYLDVAKQVTRDLEDLFGAPTAFIHPMPDQGTYEKRRNLLDRLVGGAGFDLDSLVTFLPQKNGESRALVASIGMGRELLKTLTEKELLVFAEIYGLQRRNGMFRDLIDAQQDSIRARGLEDFLNLVTQNLENQGYQVARLPHLLLETAFTKNPGRYPNLFFQIGWNNVVTERDGDPRRAEGFGSGIPSADFKARQIFEKAGYSLTLIPPLVESIMRQGGYRCASKHIRRPKPKRT